jgi:CheY-like chemotaxis protein
LILVADDSPTIQRRAQGILQGEGFEVETVSNGVAAIKKLPKLQPILVIADVSMPGKDGYEVCDYVKTSADFRHVPVLLVGSDLEPYDQQRGAQVGADGIIKKPFSPQDLVAMVAKFTGLGEAPASPPTRRDATVTSFPAAVPEVSPRGSGAESSTKSQEQDLAALPAGVASTCPPLDEIPAKPVEPLPDFPLQSAPNPALQAWEQSSSEPLPEAPRADALGGSTGALLAPPEPFPGFALEPTPKPTPESGLEEAPESAVLSRELIFEPAPAAVLESALLTPETTSGRIPEAAPEPARVSVQLNSEPAPEAMPEPTLPALEPTPAPLAEAAPEPARVSPQLNSEPAPEAMPEPTLPTPESTPAPLAEAAPESPPVSPQLISGPVPEAMPEATLPTPESTPASLAEVAPEPTAVSPRLISETAAEVSSECVSVVTEPAAESGLPLLIDELVSAHPAPELHPSGEEKHPKPKVATSLNGFSLAEAAEGRVYVAPPESEAGTPPEAEVIQPGGAPPASAPSVVGREWVYVVVRKVVLKMAPPALPAELVEELARVLTQEITSELDSPSQVY